MDDFLFGVRVRDEVLLWESSSVDASRGMDGLDESREEGRPNGWMDWSGHGWRAWK